MYLLTEGMLCRAALLVTVLYMGTSGPPPCQHLLNQPGGAGRCDQLPLILGMHRMLPVRGARGSHGHPTPSRAECHPAPALGCSGCSSSMLGLSAVLCPSEVAFHRSPWCRCPCPVPALPWFHKQVLPSAQPLQADDGLCSHSPLEQGSNSINETLEF